jgi:hypothetical protein
MYYHRYSSLKWTGCRSLPKQSAKVYCLCTMVRSK